jgi:uncharacterized protein (TIGR02118 family)
MRRLTLVRRNPAFTQAQFVEHWLGEHAALAAQLPGVRGYRINEIVEAPPEFPWHGVAELWFDSADAAKQAMASDPAGTTLRRDTKKLAAEVAPFYIAEHTIIEPPSG